jgi:hypothetical protein
MFKAGSTYVWDRLDGEPTPEGRARVEEIARLLGGADFEVIAHEAGVRPIVRKSQPVIGPLADGRIVFNDEIDTTEHRRLVPQAVRQRVEEMEKSLENVANGPTAQIGRLDVSPIEIR